MPNVDYKVNVSESGSGRMIAGIAIGCGCSLLMAFVLIIVLAMMYFSTARVVHHERFSLPTPSDHPPIQGFRDIFHAAAEGSVNDVQLFIGQGVDVNERIDKKNTSGICVLNSQGVSILLDPSGTPLHCAARHNHIEVVKYLIEIGANVNAQDEYGKPPLDVASTDEKKTILREAGGKTQYELSGFIL